jgi:hypothetical protein
MLEFQLPIHLALFSKYCFNIFVIIVKLHTVFKYYTKHRNFHTDSGAYCINYTVTYNTISITVLAGTFMPLFQRTFLFNSAHPIEFLNSSN